jgi:hypothetical protein
MKPIFIKIVNFWARADNLGQQILGHFLYFQNLFGTVSSLSMFSLINHYFYKKLSLYIEISNIYLGLGFEFGPPRIRNLAVVYP